MNMESKKAKKKKHKPKIQTNESPSVDHNTVIADPQVQTIVAAPKKKRHRKKNKPSNTIVGNTENIEIKPIESIHDTKDSKGLIDKKTDSDDSKLITTKKDTENKINIENNVLICPVKPEITPEVKENIVELNNLTDKTNLNISKMETQNTDKSRDEIKAEREAKKLAKQLAKNKSKLDKPNSVDASSINKSMKNLTINSTLKPESSKQPLPEKKTVTIAENQSKPNEIKPAENQDKSKSELRAERRAKQEAQRAAKAEQLVEKAKPAADKKENSVPKKISTVDKSKCSLTDDAKIEMKKSNVADKTKLKSIQNRHKVKLFNHLYTEKENFAIPLNSEIIPPVIVRLGLQYKNHVIVGSNARCIALLRALRIIIKDFVASPNTVFSRDLEMHLDECMKFLKSCRPHAVSMDNAVKYIKARLRNMTHDTEEDAAKAKLEEYIETYINEQIEVAGKAISNSVNEKITDGDIILTYGCSTLIEKILVDASANPGKEFSVVIVAANPWNDGREMLRRLTAKNINCSLVMISAISFIMQKINKVILGAGALLANGYVMARAGTAQIAMVARAYNVPVLVCCESHKFSERAQTDSFVHNEIGDPDALITCNTLGNSKSLQNWRDIKTLTPLNLSYDVTPHDLVTAVVTELGLIPCTSVPVVLRVKPSEAGM